MDCKFPYGHRWTGRYEAHLWDKNCWNESQTKKGRQGAYDDEEAAAHAYDLAALKYWGLETVLNFPLETYEEELTQMEGQSKEEYIGSLKSQSSGKVVDSLEESPNIEVLQDIISITTEDGKLGLAGYLVISKKASDHSSTKLEMCVRRRIPLTLRRIRRRNVC